MVPKQYRDISSRPAPFREKIKLKIDSIPRTLMGKAGLMGGIPAFKLFEMTGLSRSGSAARRLIDQGGAYVNGERIQSFDSLVTIKDVSDNEILMRAGKKIYHRIKDRGVVITQTIS